METIEVPDSAKLPEEAYRYWPTNDYLYQGQDKSIVRYIFYKTPFTPFETNQVAHFKSLIEFSLPEFFCDEELLRILIGSKFDKKKALKALESAIDWREANLRNSYATLHPRVAHLLNQGSIYIHGRDHRYRPILCINVGRMNLNNYSIEEYCDLVCFHLEYMIQNMLMPGQVENWIVITDLCSLGISSLPKSELKKIIKVLQDNFRCRMIVNYVINAPRTISWIWNFVKGFLEHHTANKIKIKRESTAKEMLTHIAANQLEQKYGGSAPDLNEFWPPTVPPPPFHTPDESPENYLTPEPQPVPQTFGNQEFEVEETKQEPKLEDSKQQEVEVVEDEIEILHSSESDKPEPSTADVKSPVNLEQVTPYRRHSESFMGSTAQTLKPQEKKSQNSENSEKKKSRLICSCVKTKTCQLF